MYFEYQRGSTSLLALRRTEYGWNFENLNGRNGRSLIGIDGRGVTYNANTGNIETIGYGTQKRI